MPKFVIYSVWTDAQIIEADNVRDAYDKGYPTSMPKEPSLCNWHVVPLPVEQDLIMKIYTPVYTNL